MHVLVSCKNEKVPIKTEGARVVTKCLPLQVYGDFSDGQGKLFTTQSIVGSGRISNTSEVALVTCKMKKIRLMMELECSQHYTSILDAQGQLTP